MRFNFKSISLVFLTLFGLSACNYSDAMSGVQITQAVLGQTGIFGSTKRIFSRRAPPRPKQSLNACINDLKNAGLHFTVLSQDRLGRCTIRNQVVMNRSLYPYSAPVKGQCGLIKAISAWERNVVAPAAHKYLGTSVTQVIQMGNFSCRTIAGTNRLSEHGKANAIDIGGFKLRNGRSVSVKKHWRKNSPEGRFLQAVRNGSCSVFVTVLSPDYNAAHRDHFHFDMGGWDMCR